MPFKSSKAFEVGKFLQSQLSRKTILGQGVGGGGSASPGIPNITATGGTETTVVASDGKTYKIHTFTSTGANTFTVSSADSTATAYLYLQGAGGGGAASPESSCGAGSGNLAQAQISLESGSYSINIGTGGNGGGARQSGNPGNPSSFTTPSINITAGGSSGGPLPPAPDGAIVGGSGATLTTFTSGDKVILISSASVNAPGAQKGGQPGRIGGPGDIWTPAFNTPSHFLFPRSPVQNKGRGGGGGNNSGGTGGDGYAQIYYEIPPS